MKTQTERMADYRATINLGRAAAFMVDTDDMRTLLPLWEQMQAEKAASDGARYFTSGFSDGTAYIRVTIVESFVHLRNGMKMQCNPGDYTLEECLRFVKDGCWREITAQEAAAMIQPK